VTKNFFNTVGGAEKENRGKKLQIFLAATNTPPWDIGIVREEKK